MKTGKYLEVSNANTTGYKSNILELVKKKIYIKKLVVQLVAFLDLKKMQVEI